MNDGSLVAHKSTKTASIYVGYAGNYSRSTNLTNSRANYSNLYYLANLNSPISTKPLDSLVNYSVDNYLSTVATTPIADSTNANYWNYYCNYFVGAALAKNYADHLHF